MRGLAVRLAGLLWLIAAPLALAAAPIPNWKQQAPGLWTSADGRCALKQQQLTTHMKIFPNRAAAAGFAPALQRQLFAQHFTGVVVGPIYRFGQWGLLAYYHYHAAQGDFQIWQLYLSRKGLAETLTGSARAGLQDPCVTNLERYLG
jgi:hypothetical protein